MHKCHPRHLDRVLARTHRAAPGDAGQAERLDRSACRVARIVDDVHPSRVLDAPQRERLLGHAHRRRRDFPRQNRRAPIAEVTDDQRTRSVRDGAFDIYVMSSSGGSVLRLTSLAGDDRVPYYLDSSRIVFVSAQIANGLGHLCPIPQYCSRRRFGRSWP